MLYHSPGGDTSVPIIPISVSGDNVDLAIIAQANGWDGVSLTPRLIFHILPGVEVGSDNTSNYSLTTGSLPQTSNLTLINEGTIAGAGGKGGYGTPTSGTVGAVGGPAFNPLCPIQLDNTNGIIGGGGGGGAGGRNDDGGGGESFDDPGGGGGGGAGRTPGVGGGHSVSSSGGGIAGNGDIGTLLTGGAGGRNESGDGGGMGSYAGTGGGLGLVGGSSNANSGGAAGVAIDGVSKVVFIARGDIRGSEIN
ncbi:MAG: hypothetical protein V7776_04975 [Halopseudomonas aestusnigri]